MIRFKSESGCILAVDITASGISFLLVDLSAKLLGTQQVSFAKKKTNPKAVCAMINSQAQLLLRKHGMKQKQLLAVVAGVPAITNVDEGIVLTISTLEQWRSVRLRDMLKGLFGCVVIVENDTNLAAQGEHYRGAAQREESFILITIGKGTGAGIVLNGKIHHGSQWSAGEIGYLRVPHTTRRRPMIHEFGELEAVLSSTSIIASWNEMADGVRPEVMDATAILDMAEAGVAQAAEIVQHRAGILTDIIVNLSLILNPGLILLSGPVGSHPMMVRAVQRQLEECEFAVPDLKAGALAEDAVLWGAVSLALDMVPSVLLPAT
jgi:glucokinase